MEDNILWKTVSYEKQWWRHPEDDTINLNVRCQEKYSFLDRASPILENRNFATSWPIEHQKNMVKVHLYIDAHEA